MIGVNTFLGQDGSPIQVVREVMRSSDDEKQAQVQGLQDCHQAHAVAAPAALQAVQRAALAGENVFAALMTAAQCCSLGQMSAALYEVGGQYRRNM